MSRAIVSMVDIVLTLFTKALFELLLFLSIIVPPVKVPLQKPVSESKHTKNRQSLPHAGLLW